MNLPRVIGWEPIQAEWWLVIRATLPKPWPREAVLMDLRFWRGQELATAERAEKDRVARPGRPTLLKDWGWTDWAVKAAFKAEDEWQDPRRDAAASEPPAYHQRTASLPPAAKRLEADNPQISTSEPPANRQPTTSEPPRARSFTPIHRSPITEIRSEACASAIPDQTPQVHLFPPIGLPPVEPPEAIGGAETRAAIPESNQGHARPVSGASEEKPAALSPDLMAVWAAYRFHHPRCGATPPSGSKRVIERALKDFSGEELVGVVRWFHESSDSKPVYMRKEGYDGIDNIFRIEALPGKVEAAGKPWQQVQATGSGPVILDAEGNVLPPKPAERPAPKGANDGLAAGVSLWELAEKARAAETQECNHG